MIPAIDARGPLVQDGTCRLCGASVNESEEADLVRLWVDPESWLSPASTHWLWHTVRGEL